VVGSDREGPAVSVSGPGSDVPHRAQQYAEQRGRYVLAEHRAALPH
jgi:hypothetical protein